MQTQTQFELFAIKIVIRILWFEILQHLHFLDIEQPWRSSITLASHLILLDLAYITGKSVVWV